MASKIIGVEIGSDSLKFAVLSGGKAKAMAVERLPDNLVREGRIVNAAAMTDFVKSSLKKHGIRPAPCALVLPQQVVMARKITMPMMSESELELNLPYEFRDFVGKDASKYDYDYSVVSAQNNSLELYAAAVRTEVVEEYYGVFQKAGMKLKAAMPAEMAWLNLIRKATNEPKKVCMIDLGASMTRISIFADEHYEMGRDIEIGGRDIDIAISKNQDVDVHAARMHKESNLDNVLSSDYCGEVFSEISVEVMKVVNFYRSVAQGGNELQDLYYCGGSSEIEQIRTAILKRTNLNMHHIGRFVESDGLDDDVVLYCALAAGAAMQLQ